jgi:hypothetical protein
MSELFSADLSDKILNVVGDFQDHFHDELPSYGHSYLNDYRERLSGIEGMPPTERNKFLGETAELLDSIADDPPFASGVHHQAIKGLVKEVRGAITKTKRDDEE